MRRFATFAGQYSWQWTPADVEEWTAELVAGGLSHATICNGFHVVGPILNHDRC